MTDERRLPDPARADPAPGTGEAPGTTQAPAVAEPAAPPAPHAARLLFASEAWNVTADPQGWGLAVLDDAGRGANLLSSAVMEQTARMIETLEGAGLRGLVIASGKKDFILGANVDEIAAVKEAGRGEAASRMGHAVFRALERLPFPTCAAIEGRSFGGGTELALACTHRVAAASAGIALPEVKLGILPGWGGTQRMTARIGLRAALDLMLTGRTADGRKAERLGLVDLCVPEGAARAIALRLLKGEFAPAKRRGTFAGWFLDRTGLGRSIVCSQARKGVHAKGGHHYAGPLRIVEAAAASFGSGGYDREARLLGECLADPRTHAVLNLFRATENARHQGKAWDEEHLGEYTGIVGAGIMGGGIAHLFASHGLTARVKDLAEGPLQTAMRHAADLCAKDVARGRLAAAQREQILHRILPCLDLSGFTRTDFIVEAVIEKVAVKATVLAELQSLPGASARIVASNTSSIPITLLQEGLPYPENVVGMHFFNPVHRMPLVEVISGRDTSARTAQKAFALAARLGKTPVLVKDGPGFLVNRLLLPYMNEAIFLREEGASTEAIDRAAVAFGMPMGPLELLDVVGLDTALHVGRFLQQSFGERMPFPSLLEKMVQEGRQGAKNGKGFYQHVKGHKEGALPVPVHARASLAIESIQERLFIPLALEALRCLEEGVVSTPRELDMAMVLGTGFPPWRGGPLTWIEAAGKSALAERARPLFERFGARFDPSVITGPLHGDANAPGTPVSHVPAAASAVADGAPAETNDKPQAPHPAVAPSSFETPEELRGEETEKPQD